MHKSNKSKAPVRIVLLHLLILAFITGHSQSAGLEVLLPNKEQLAWADAEVGVIIHFDLYSFRQDYDWRKWGTHPDPSVFNPARLNTDQWLQAAKAAGATYAVLVAKHCTGFSLWPTDAHGYSVKNSPWKEGKGDIVYDFIQSCKKYGLKPGIYASASANGYLYVDNPGLVQPGSPVTQTQYNRIVEQQLTELWSRYGPLFEIWFDGGVLPVDKGGPDIVPLLKKLQPDAIVFQGPTQAKNLIRWIGNEEGTAPYPNWSTADTTTSATGTVKVEHMGGDPAGKLWCPGEADFPLRDGWQGGWFWQGKAQHLLTVEQLLQKYHTSVGRNANMLLGMVIDTTGLVPEEDVARLTAFGDALRKEFAHPVYQRAASGDLIELSLGNTASTFNCIVLEEDIAKGETIRNYTIEALLNGQWKKIAEGTSVGHKHIQLLKNVTATKIRVHADSEGHTAKFKNISLFQLDRTYD